MGIDPVIDKIDFSQDKAQIATLARYRIDRWAYVDDLV